MSDRTDNFIKNHKPYFDRNAVVIKANGWNDSESYKDETDSLLQQLSELLKNDGDTKEISKIKQQISDIGTEHHKNKAELFKQENTLASSITGRLSAFIKESESNGERQLPKVQKFIDYTVEIIKIHIDKCEEYLAYNIDVIKDSNTKPEEDKEYKSQEILFQDSVFQKKIGILDTLQKLNIKSSTEDLEKRFYKDAKASLILKEPLEILDTDVKLKVDSLSVEWNLSTSNEMFINMNPKDIPQWNTKKHFFDQDQVVLQFWTEEYNKIKNGITIGGYFIHPWLYFHLNFFKTPIPQEDGSEPTVQPGLRDNEWFFAENLKNCISKEYPGYYSKAMLVYGTRRFAKSVILASLAQWRTLTKHNSFGSIVGGNSSDLNALTSKIKTSMTYSEPAFKLGFIKQNWENGETTFGIKEDASNNIVFSSLIVQNLESGAKSSTQKTAGLAPSVSIYDEIGKYAFLKPYLAALPSFKTPYGFKCVTCLAGTGGEADLSVDAMSVLANPESYSLLPMDWDKLESKIDPEFITWKRRKFATFFPGQMAYEEGFIKEPQKFSDFLGIKDEGLNNINIDVTNWEKNKRLLEDKVEDAKSVKGSKGRLLEQQQKVQYPIDPEDCFMSSEDNPFLPLECKVHKEKIIEQGDIGKKVVLYERGGRVEYEMAENKPLPNYPFEGGFIDSPAIIYIEPPQNQSEIQEYEFCSSLDDYKQEQSNGDSVGSFTIFRRNCMDKNSMQIAAEYNARPDPHRKFHQQGLLLLKMYNAKCFPENEDMDFKIFLDTKNLTWRYLVKGINLAQDLDLNSNGNREYGWSPTEKNINFMYGLIKNYISQEIEEYNEEGEVVRTYLGLERIKSVGILEELQNFKKDGNFDRLRSFGGALMYDHYLTSQYIIPRPTIKAEKEKREKMKKKKRRSHSMFGNTPGRVFGK
ncbi:MAG: hypothetical protein CMH22_06305 [Methylophaga sp.]|nr:hypothetical protein [Methylophaga sp.]|tara:strand:- start:29750 stop:32512 length:2763 start_codon:yes stop_codon:yes gene_type:complete